MLVIEKINGELLNAQTENLKRDFVQFTIEYIKASQIDCEAKFLSDTALLKTGFQYLSNKFL